MPVLRPLHRLYAVPTQNLPGLETFRSCLEISVALKGYGNYRWQEQQAVRDTLRLDLPFTRGHSTNFEGQQECKKKCNTGDGFVCRGDVTGNNNSLAGAQKIDQNIQKAR